MTGGWCDLGDLPVEQCGCDKHRGKGLRADTLGLDIPERSMAARFDTRCPGCGARILTGAVIHLIDGQWVCGRHAL